LLEYFKARVWGIVLAKIGDGVYPVYSENGTRFYILNVVQLMPKDLSLDRIETWIPMPEPEDAEID